jgi:hypothetical protein
MHGEGLGVCKHNVSIVYALQDEVWQFPRRSQADCLLKQARRVKVLGT